MKYKVEIEETLLRTVEIEAESAADAEVKAQQMYRAEEIVLNADDFTGNVQFHVMG